MTQPLTLGFSNKPTEIKQNQGNQTPTDNPQGKQEQMKFLR